MSDQEVVLIADDHRFGMQAGDRLSVEPYWLDPGLKFTVLSRLSDGFVPGCNVYRCQVTRPDGRPFRCGCGCASASLRGESR